MDSAASASSAPPPAAGVRCVLRIKLPPAAVRARCVLRIRPPPAWTPDEDALLEHLATEHGFRCWRRVASRMPGRSSRQCRDRWRHHLARDVYHRPFTARDDADLARLYLRHAGRWKDIARAVHGRTSRVMRRRWKEIRDTDALLRKIWQPPPPPATPADHHASDSSSTSLSSQQAYADVVASCSLCRDTVNVASGGSLVAGFTCTPVV